MKAICALLCLLVLAVSAEWQSGHNEFFDGKTKAQITKLLGWKKNPSEVLEKKVMNTAASVPTAFDSRTQWPSCTSIGTIQNQAEWSCWAFGAVESITDRFCIHKNNDTQLSFADMVSCDPYDGGCDGGDPSTAWKYAMKDGLVTAACYPYTIPTCPPAQQPCLNFVNTPKCAKACNNTNINYKDDKHKISSVYGVSAHNSGIETEIMTNGPVEACFDVYEDFLKYKSGVYIHQSGSLLGGHCIKVLGWGVDNGTDYWIVANSWTNTWGNQGYFWIRRGTDECGIEDQVVAGMP